MTPLPVWPPTGNVFFANAEAIFATFRAAGFSIPASLGLLAQAEAESACEIAAKGDHDAQGEPTAFGLFQWHGPRIAAIKAGCGVDILAFPSIADQVEAAVWELHTFPALGLAQIVAATTASEAGIAGCQYFERAGAADAAERRGAMAERWSAYAETHNWMQ